MQKLWVSPWGDCCDDTGSGSLIGEEEPDEE